MKKLLLALAFLAGSVASAAAACTSPATMHDFLGSAFLMSMSTNADGNCQSNVQAYQGTSPWVNSITVWGGGTLGAMANFGTSPGAVLVPGMNAAAFQFGTWTVQPGNTPNTTPWLFQGNVSNASDGVATGSISAPAVGYNYVFNGTTWDRARGDATNGAWVNVKNANTNGQAIAANSSPVVAPVLTVAGAAVVKGGVPVVNGASIGNTVAASQTAQVLSATQGGGTGAAGDYISHCLIQPTTTAAGTVTVLDNATVMYTFTTGTLSNLATIPVPLGMVSVSGAWKVTTGANEIVTCVGKFS